MNRLGLILVSLLSLVGCAGQEAVEPAQVESQDALVQNQVYERPIHMVYARTGGKAFAGVHDDDELLNALKKVPGGVTALVPFLLNVPDPSIYAPMINKLKAQGTIIVPGIGQDPDTDGPINSPRYKEMARKHQPYTDYIRIENVQGYYDRAGGKQPIQDMIDHMVSLGFKHIMLNPWPRTADGRVVPFTNHELDSTIYQVLLSTDAQNRPDNSPTNFYPGNPNKIHDMLDYRPSIKILINYESAPQHEVLEQMEKDKPGSSKQAMNITATQIEQGKDDLHWCPPFTEIYDPIELGTWTWMANRLGDFK